MEIQKIQTQTPELINAWRFVETTGVSIFLTGKAGTGKTTFLRYLREHSCKTMAVVAPTGVAAINARGVTIHSFFQLPLTPYIPGSDVKDKYSFSKDKLRIIRALDLLVIDEISMVRGDLLDAIDHVLRRIRRSSLPFGGVQLLMIGDLQQLSPVVTGADLEVLHNYYDTPYFFSSRALAQIDYVTIQLTKVFRQQDERFISLLNNVRDNCLTEADLKALAAKYDPAFRPADGSDYIRLTTHNSYADDYNHTQLLLLKGAQQTFHAQVQGTFPDYSYPTDSALTLKIGAQVMFVRNDPSPDRKYYNGKIGHVVGFEEDGVAVRCVGEDYDILVGPQKWENARYVVNAETQEVTTEVQGVFSQLPLRLAWAITIHKSQGLTFEHAIIDAGQSFAPGQVYVALSRCRTLEGLVLSSPITPAAITVDGRVERFISTQESEAERSINRLPEIERAYFSTLLIKLFDFAELAEVQERLTRILAESFHNMFPGVTRNQGEVMKRMATEVTEVSHKWSRLILSQPYEFLTGEEFGVRVRKSAGYFMDKMLDLIGQRIKDVKSVNSGNKTVMKRLDAIRDDLVLAYSHKVLLLKNIAESGFTVENYLRFKQKAILSGGGKAAGKASGRSPRKTMARTSGSISDEKRRAFMGQISGPSREERARQREEAREEAREQRRLAREAERERKRIEKANQPKSWDVTYKRFREGATREEIAQERQLAPSTIMSHLLRFVESGDLNLEEIIGVNQTEAINRVVAQYGPETPVAELQQHLPGIHPTDIYAVIRHYRASAADADISVDSSTGAGSSAD